MMFSKRLREIRKSSGLSQRALAEQIGVNFTYISKLENKRLEPPSEDLLIKMAQALEVDKYALIFFAEKVPKEIQNMIVKDVDLQSLLISKLREGKEIKWQK